MITKIMVWSYRDLKYSLINNPWRESPRHLFISMRDPMARANELFDEGEDRSMMINPWDIDPDQNNEGVEKEAMDALLKKGKLFSKKDAMMIKKFVDRHHKEEIPQTLHISCERGHSLSGTIAKKLNQYLQLDEAWFSRNNKALLNNQYVLNRLEEVF